MLRIIWDYGTRAPIQRVGLILLFCGILISMMWAHESSSLKYYFQDVIEYPPRNSGEWFYKLYLYFIPFGLLLTWLYPFFRKIINCIATWIFKNK